ncbi:pyridoxamine 5'-phosphate oxidase family protein [Mycolicibacterium sp. HS_4_1]
MSAHVDLDQLAGAVDDFAFAYLVTVTDDHRAHVVTVQPTLADGVFDIAAIGTRTSENLKHHSDVTLIYPPREADGYTLLIDGRADVKDTRLQVFPSRAILHRQARPDTPAAASGCLHDCVPIEQ